MFMNEVNPKHLAKLTISTEQLINLFRSMNGYHLFITSCNLPPDAQVVGCVSDPLGRAITLYLSSPSFGNTYGLSDPPTLDLVINEAWSPGLKAAMREFNENFGA